MNNMPTLFAGFRLNPVDLSGFQFWLWPVVVYADRRRGSDDDKKIKKQVCGPGHTVQYSPAGTGQLVVKEDQYRCDVDRKAAHQRKGKPKPFPSGRFPAKQSDGNYFQSRDRIDQRIGKPFRERLQIKLRPEEFRINQFADCRVSEEQHECCSNYQLKIGLHMPEFDKAKEKHIRKPKQYEMGSIPSIAGYDEC